MKLIPLELQPTSNTSRRKAREAYLIHRGQTLEPSGTDEMNAECLTILHYLRLIYFILFYSFYFVLLYVLKLKCCIHLSAISFISYTLTAIVYI